MLGRLGRVASASLRRAALGLNFGRAFVEPGLLHASYIFESRSSHHGQAATQVLSE